MKIFLTNGEGYDEVGLKAVIKDLKKIKKKNSINK